MNIAEHLSWRRLDPYFGKVIKRYVFDDFMTLHRY